MIRINNPYEGVDFSSAVRVKSITHEHIDSNARLQKAYNRGIRHFASVWYQPSSPIYPYSNSSHQFLDYLYYDTTHPASSSGTIDVTYNSAKLARESVDFVAVKQKGLVVAYSLDGINVLYTKLLADNWSTEDEDWEAVSESELDNALETYEATFAKQLSSFTDENEQTQSTDTLPQVPNSEKVYLEKSSGGANQHINALGVLHASAGVYERRGLHRDFRLRHYIYKLDEMYAIYEQASNNQFGKNFYTINHCNLLSSALSTINDFGNHFNAFEVFNQGYSVGWNGEFRGVYDTLLKNGYKLNVTAVADWQGDISAWQYTTASERSYWIDAYSQLPAEDKARYEAEFELTDKSTYLYGGRVEGYWYYTYHRECKVDRGCNVLLVGSSYDNLPANSFDKSNYQYSKAEAGLDAYIGGKYYASGRGVHYITDLEVTNNFVRIEFDSAARIRGISNINVIESTGTSLTFPINKGITYIRFEAFFDTNVPSGWGELDEEDQEAYVSLGVYDFIFTNPIWIEGNDHDDTAKKLLLILD